MDDMGARILDHLDAVAQERGRRDRDAALQRQVAALKVYQQQRFRHSYADLLADPRYRPAALYFLDELYGPEDFTRRDEQFARIVGPLVRLFPREILRTVERLAALHALSERLDSAMAQRAPSGDWTRVGYVQAWQAVDCAEERRQQIRLLLEVGSALDRLTRNAVLRHSLRAMRGPAKTAGLAELQAFLERGFDTFRQMRGADAFLALVEAREEALRLRLFAPDALAATQAPPAGDPLGQLP
jgi:hypothetical protein